MKHTKIALCILLGSSLVACSSSNKSEDNHVADKPNKPAATKPSTSGTFSSQQNSSTTAPKPNSAQSTYKAETTYQSGNGKYSLTYVPNDKKEKVANIKYSNYKLKSFANNADDKVDSIYVDGKEFTKLSSNLFLIDENLKLGLEDYDVVYMLKDGSTETHNRRIYNMPYSLIAIRDAGILSFLKEPWVEGQSGLNPESKAIDDLVKNKAVFTYKGKAFDMNNEGNLTYIVDFGNKTGKGKIEDFGYDSKEIKLNTARLEKNSFHNIENYSDPIPAKYKNTDPDIGFRGKTDLDDKNTYVIKLHGPKAEEITGAILAPNKELAVYSPTKDLNNVTEFNGIIAIAGCRDSKVCK